MLLCYVYVPGKDEAGNTVFRAQLSITSDKPDTFSVPVPIEALVETDSAIIRVGPGEALKVSQDPKGGVVCSPLTGAKLYLTPDLMERPGITVKTVKIAKGPKGFEVYFRHDKDGPDDWRPWRPNDSVG